MADWLAALPTLAFALWGCWMGWRYGKRPAPKTDAEDAPYREAAEREFDAWVNPPPKWNDDAAHAAVIARRDANLSMLGFGTPDNDANPEYRPKPRPSAYVFEVPEDGEAEYAEEFDG